MSVLYWLLGFNDPGSIARASDWLFYPARPVGVPVLVVLTVVAIGLAALNVLPQNIMRWRTRAALTAVRLAGFAVLALMLCQIELRLTVERVARPNIAVLTDTSASMSLADVDGRSRLDAARAFAAGALQRLAGRAELVRYDFSWQLQAEDAAAEPQGMTRLVAALDGLARREDDLQAVILLTDGNDTTGDRGGLVAPLLASRGLPVHPVVFGSPGPPKVARVKVSEAAPYVRLGDELRLTAALSSEGLGEQVVRVLLFEDGRATPADVRDNIRLGKGPIEVSFVVKPSRVGVRTYRFALEGVRGTAGKSGRPLAEHKVRVIDAKIRVLYLDVPRDERKILGHWLARDPVVDLAALTLLPKGGWHAQGALEHKDIGEGLPDQEADLHRYDVIILGDIPRSYFRAGSDVAETKMQRFVDFVTRRGGGLITLGGQAVYTAGQYQDSPLATILPFVIEPTDKPQVPKPFKLIPTPIGLGHPAMQLAWEPQANRDAWFDLPALDGCNRVERIKPGATLLAVRDVESRQIPVLALQSVGKGKVLSLAADTTWRWEMMRPAEGEDHFSHFWGNVVRFLAPDPRIAPNSPQILRYQSHAAIGQRVTLATRLVDAVYKPVREANLVVKVTSPSGKVLHIYPRDGRDAPGLYQYSIALDEPGPWQVAATCGGKTTTEEIVAGEGDEEMDDPRAKPEAMAELARATGGKALAPQEAAAFFDQLRVAPRRFTETTSVALWNLPATMILMIGLVAADCFIRKRKGMV
jgi:uncharacterized membrane protein